MLWGAIKQSNQSIARFKLCNGSYQAPHPMQICCPKTNFLNQMASFYYFTYIRCVGGLVIKIMTQFPFDPLYNYYFINVSIPMSFVLFTDLLNFFWRFFVVLVTLPNNLLKLTNVISSFTTIHIGSWQFFKSNTIRISLM